MGVLSDLWDWFKWALGLMPYHGKRALWGPSGREQITSGIIIAAVLFIAFFWDITHLTDVLGILVLIYVFIVGGTRIVAGNAKNRVT